MTQAQRENVRMFAAQSAEKKALVYLYALADIAERGDGTVTIFSWVAHRAGENVKPSSAERQYCRILRRLRLFPKLLPFEEIKSKVGPHTLIPKWRTDEAVEMARRIGTSIYKGGPR